MAINRDPVLDDKGRIKTFFTLENAQAFVEAVENLIGALNALEAAAMVDKDGSTPETLNAAKGLRTALQDMALLGVSKDGLQYVLNAWTDATGGPRVTLRP